MCIIADLTVYFAKIYNGISREMLNNKIINLKTFLLLLLLLQYLIYMQIQRI